jgi:hypothetical protein
MAVPYIILGPCTIVWKDWTFLTTEDGVHIRNTESWEPISTDAYGQMPAGLMFLGKQASISFTAVDISTLASASTGVFVEGLGMSVKTGTLMLDAIGACMSSYADEITITDASLGVWTAGKAFPLDPERLLLSAVQELRLPFTFHLLKDGSGDIFSTVPSTFQASS